MVSAGVVRVDERFVKFEPDPLPFGATVKNEDSSEYQSDCERQTPK
jgi:hypothetical protein